MPGPGGALGGGAGGNGGRGGGASGTGWWEGVASGKRRVWGGASGTECVGGGASPLGPRPWGPLLVVPQSRGLGAPASLGPRREAGPQKAGLLPACCPPASSPGPPLFTRVVTCSVATRVSGAWCRGSVRFVGPGLQSRGPQLNRRLSTLGQRTVSRLDLPGVPSFRPGQHPMSPQAPKETGAHGVSDVRSVPEGPTQGHGAHELQGAGPRLMEAGVPAGGAWRAERPCP